MRAAVPALLAALALLGGCGENATAPADTESGQVPGGEPAGEDTAQAGDGVEVEMRDAQDQPVGTVTLTADGERTRVAASIDGLEPGFYGFHVHQNADCDPDAPDGPFTTAGGHYSPEGGAHGAHAGDLPNLLVGEDGRAEMTVSTDRFALGDLRAAGGAFIVHAGADNHANVPERYLDGGPPDEDTLATGDAGPRQACGVIGEPAATS